MERQFKWDSAFCSVFECGILRKKLTNYRLRTTQHVWAQLSNPVVLNGKIFDWKSKSDRHLCVAALTVKLRIKQLRNMSESSPAFGFFINHIKSKEQIGQKFIFNITLLLHRECMIKSTSLIHFVPANHILKLITCSGTDVQIKQ